jgi:hypothetical protein
VYFTRKSLDWVRICTAKFANQKSSFFHSTEVKLNRTQRMAPVTHFYFLTQCKRGVKLTTYLHLVARSKNAWSYTSTFQYTFMAWCLFKHGGKFALPLPFSCLPCVLHALIISCYITYECNIFTGCSLCEFVTLTSFHDLSLHVQIYWRRTNKHHG